MRCGVGLGLVRAAGKDGRGLWAEVKPFEGARFLVNLVKISRSVLFSVS